MIPVSEYKGKVVPDWCPGCGNSFIYALSFFILFSMDSFLCVGSVMANDNEPDYKRYEFTENGVSKRAFPGQPGLMHNEDSDEHNEYGAVVSDAITDPTQRKLSMEKRMKNPYAVWLLLISP